MRQLVVPILALALGVATALSLAACGGEDAKLLPGATAAEISENLDTVKQLANEGECIGAADAADQVRAQVEDLTNVDSKLKQALERGATRLDEVVSTCEEAETEVVPPPDQTEAEEKLPPGQAKKEEKERDKEERELEKEEEKAETPVSPEKESPPNEEATPPPSEGGGTGAPGGVGPATPAPEGE